MGVNVTTNHELRYCCSVQPLSLFFLFLAGGKKKSDTGAPLPVSSASKAADRLLLGVMLGLASARAATSAAICPWPEGTIRESFLTLFGGGPLWTISKTKTTVRSVVETTEQVPTGPDKR